jgi:YYY domain-containing protein
MRSVALWWLMMEGLGLIGLPLTFALFSRRSSGGYPFTKILVPLLLTYVSWLAGHFIPMPLAVRGTLVLLIVAAALAAWPQRKALTEWLRRGGLNEIVRHDLLWTAGFLFFAWHRSLHPEIFQQEKYMDFSFFNLLARTGSMPPEDPWMSGEVINYYYFGYLTFANLARLMPLATPISYNLCVATIGGLAFSQATAVALQLTRRWGLALFGGATCVLLGNLDGFLQLLEKGTIRGMDFWRSSRIVDGDATINEFPFFSTIHGDLHPHFMVLPVSIVLLGILLDERLFPSRAEDQPSSTVRSSLPFAVVTFVLGAMIAISNWELPIGALLVTLLAGRWQPLLPLFSKERAVLALRIVAVLVGAYLLFLPFYLTFSPPLGGVGVKLARTSLAQFLTVFGFLLFPPALLVGLRGWSLFPARAEARHLILAVGALLIIIAAMAGNGVLPLLFVLLGCAFAVAYLNGDDGHERAGYLLIVAATAALLATEIVYIKDAYGERLYRMNTVFKLYFQAWIVLSVALPWCVGRLLAMRWQWEPARHLLAASVAVLLAASTCYPLGLSLDRMNATPTLDGNHYLQRPEYADDLAAINWLRGNVSGQPVILEATGNPYSYFARISSNTGLPTVLGWANHEGLWRGHDRIVGERASHVARMYSAATLEEIRPLLDQYRVRYVVVGNLERKTYRSDGLSKFETLPVAFRSGGTTIYRTED